MVEGRLPERVSVWGDAFRHSVKHASGAFITVAGMLGTMGASLGYHPPARIVFFLAVGIGFCYGLLVFVTDIGGQICYRKSCPNRLTSRQQRNRS